MEDAENRWARDGTKQLREESRALPREIRGMVATSSDACRWKRNRHGESSWEDAGEEYDRGGDYCGYHDEPDGYKDGYCSYGHE